MEKSIFVFGGNHPASPFCGSIFKLDLTTEKLERVARFTHKTLSDPENYVGLSWCVCFTGKNKLCLLPKWPCLLGEYQRKYIDGGHKYSKKEEVTGYIYDIKANTTVEINAPMCDNTTGLVFSLQRQLYWIDNPVSEELKGGSSFQMYNMSTCKWEARPPIPWHGSVTGRAVFDGFVLCSTYFEGPWIYDVRTNKWYPLNIEDESYLFEGVGTVLENNTLYALKTFDRGEVILRVLSIGVSRETENVDFTCSILSDIKLPRQKGHVDIDFLVHLDKNAFLLLRIADKFYYQDMQPLEIVRFEVDGGKISNCTSKLTKIPERYGLSFLPQYSFWLHESVAKDIVEREPEEDITLDLIRDTKLEAHPEEVQD